MIPNRFNFIIPLAVILTASVAVFVSWPARMPEDRFDTLLQSIATQPLSEIAPNLEAAESFIDFQSKALAPKPGDELARPIADYYFQLGGALLSRPEPDYLDAARDCFLKAVELYPTLRLGWPYYQLGQLYERTGDIGKAHWNYDKVPLYNSGELSLKAYYRMALTRTFRDSDDIDIFQAGHLYEYLRFISTDIEKDIQPFTSDLEIYQPNGKGTCLEALLAVMRGNLVEARMLFQSYLRKHPNDQGAQYLQDKYINKELKTFYPGDGNLLSSCYAPRAFQDGHLLLIDNHQLRSDFYIRDTKEKTVEIEVALSNPFHQSLLVYVTVNGQTRSLNCQLKEDRFTFIFTNPRERNFVNLHVIMDDNKPVTDNPLWVGVIKLQARLIDSENPS